VWLGFYGGLTGAIAGVIIVDYWLIRRTSLKLADLYRPTGIYRYVRGWNWRAVVALVVGAFIALAGAYSTKMADGSMDGPFPIDGIIPFLKPVYDYSWLAALLIAAVLYWVFATFVPEKGQSEA
jgi:NCS1 family nucleobase:cation symporter-1